MGEVIAAKKVKRLILKSRQIQLTAMFSWGK
jgi:hypothetical protein